jgi:hypothetical protein
MIAANLWGKDEDNLFDFSREWRQVLSARSYVTLPASHSVVRLRL